MGKIKWGIIGLGSIANRFADTLLQMEEVELRGVASRSKAHAIDFGKKYNVDVNQCYGSYEELMQDDTIDVIYIAVPHPFHKENAIACLNHGKAVLCEKPVTMNEKEVKEVIDAAKHNHVFFMEAMKSRFTPVNLEIKKMLDEGVIGDLHMLRAELGFKADHESDYRIFDKNLGGGALLDIGIYPVSYAAYLLGNHPVSIHSDLHFGESDVDEMGAVQLRYDKSVMAQLYFTIHGNTTKEASIIGSKGRIHIPTFSNAQRATILTDQKEWTIQHPYEISGFEYEIREVVRCLQEGRVESSVMSWQDSIDVMKIIDRIFDRKP